MTRDRFIQTALLASIGLNLFLLGTLVPGWLGHGRDKGPGFPGPIAQRMMMPPGGPDMGPLGGPGGGPFMIIRRLANELPPADAAILNEHFEAGTTRLTGQMESFRDHVDRARALLRADPFDADALRAELRDASAKRQSLDQDMMEAMIGLLSKLSPEGRRRLAEMRPMRGGWGGPGMPMPGGIPLDPAGGPVMAPPPDRQP